MIIRVKNLLDVNSPKTFMSSAKAAAVGTIDVKNVSSFQANWAIQIGKTGEERSEIKLISSGVPSGTVLVTTANTTYEHPSDTPVYAIKFDQVVFARSTSGTAGTATAMTNGTVTITPDSDFTQFDDTSGAATYAYRTWFRNSVTTVESSQSDWLTSAGFSFYSLAKIRDRVQKKLFSSNFLKDNEQVNDWVNEWLEEMGNALINVDKSYLMGTVNVAFGTDGLGTITSTDFKDLKRMWVTYNGTDKYKATKLDTSNMIPSETYNSTHPYFIWKGDDVFQIEPEESGGTAELEYYKRNAVLTDDTDELPFSMRSYTNSFVNYALAEAYYNDDKEPKGDRYLSRATKDKELFISQMTPRSFQGVQTIVVTHSISGEDGYL